MTAKFWAGRRMLYPAAGMLCLAAALCAELPGDETNEPKAQEESASDKPADDEERVPVAVARDRAKLMHNIYASTLRVMHHRYFHGDKAVVPARAMHDVFFDISWQSKIDAKWISVNTPAMSLEHEPQTEFEKRAAKEIAQGKDAYETIEKGYYRRAGAIPLGGGCINCHTGFLQTPPKTSRYAGLVISMRVKEEEAAAK